MTTFSGTVANGITLTNKTTNPVTIDLTAQIGGAATYGILDSIFAPWTISNFGTVLGSYVGVRLNGGGQLSNNPGARIDGGVYGVLASGGPIEVDNGGTITGNAAAVQLIGGGTVFNTPYGTIGAPGMTNPAVRIIGGLGTVKNRHVIAANTSGPSVTLAQGGLIENGFAGEPLDSIGAVQISGATGTIHNDAIMAGITLLAGGTVTNGALNPTAQAGPIDISGATGQVTNIGLIATTSGIRLLAGGSVTNATSGTIIGTGYAPTTQVYAAVYATVLNSGTILTAPGNAAIRLPGGGLIHNGSASATTAVIGDVEVQNGTITNDGTIGRVTLSNGIIVNGASNQAAIADTVRIRSGQVMNYGTITATDGSLYGNYTYGLSAAYPFLSSLVNAGVIAGTIGANADAVRFGPEFITNLAPGLIVGNRYGLFTDDATISNAGTILGLGAFSAGLRIGSSATSNTIINTGTISGESTGILIAGISYSKYSGAVITNYGVISGATGIAGYDAQTTLINAGTVIGTSGTAAVVQVLHTLPGSVFIGHVHGHGAAAMQLATGPGTGTITGMGAAYAGFHHIDIAPGADWVMTGINDVSATTITGQLALANATVGVFYGTTMVGEGRIATRPGGSASITNSGAIATQPNGTLELGAAIINTGTVTAAPGSTLRITGSVTGALPPPPPAGVFITAEGAEVGGRFNLDNGAFAEFAGALDASQTIGFGTTDDVSQITVDDLPDFQAAMADFGVGDSVDISGVSADFGDIADTGASSLSAAHAAAAALILPTKLLRISNNGTIIKQITLTGDTTAPYVKLQPDGHGGTILIGSATPCFAACTRILTISGEIPVESLKVGDRVVTLNSGLRPIRWIGHTTIDLARHPAPYQSAPIRIREGAFAPGVPHRDLLLSPDHAIHIDGALVPIGQLRNGATILDAGHRGTVTYFHVELEDHALLLAEGLPVESYLDTGNRSVFANGGAARILHPDLSARTWDAAACAPLHLSGPRVTAAQSALRARAVDFGFHVTTDPELRIIAPDGSALPPPAGLSFIAPGPVTLASRHTIPAERDPTRSDRRRLGIPIAAVIVDGRSLDLDDPAFATGFHPPEGHGGRRWRWTDGAASLNLPQGAAVTLRPILGWIDYWGTPEAAPAQRLVK